MMAVNDQLQTNSSKKEVLKAWLTSKGSNGASLQVHLAVSPLAHLSGVVADAVAAVLAAAEADPLPEALGVGALEGVAHVLLVHQGVDEEVHGPLVFALHHLHEIWGSGAAVKGVL